MRMPVRTIAFALPAVVGLACAHARRAETAAAPPPQAPEEQEAAVQPGVEGHAADRVLSGRVTKASSYSVSIQPIMGEERTLEIVPQTAVTVNGRESTPLALEEGQEVRASFNQVNGRDVAVKIESLGAGKSGRGGTGMWDQGTPESPPPDTGK